MSYEVQEVDRTPRRIFVTVNDEVCIINLRSFETWLADTARLEYKSYECDDLEPSTGWYFFPDYWTLCPDVNTHLIDYLIHNGQLCPTQSVCY